MVWYRLQTTQIWSCSVLDGMREGQQSPTLVVQVQLSALQPPVAAWDMDMPSLERFVAEHISQRQYASTENLPLQLP